jgi:hypothetical protein
MPEKEVPKPFLMDDLSLPQKAMLGQTSLTPGFLVLVKLIEAGCKHYSDKVIKTNPEDPNYLQVLGYRQQAARSVNEFCDLLRASVNYHVDRGIFEENQKEQEAIQLVQQRAGQ